MAATEPSSPVAPDTSQGVTFCSAEERAGCEVVLDGAEADAASCTEALDMPSTSALS